MAEIVYKCKSKNNKNVRDNELKILRENRTLGLCFEFGESEMNLKKRFYDDEKTFEEDFASLQKIKKDIEEKQSKDANQEISKNNDKKDSKKDLF